jgi:ATP-dependent DNA helicase RecQ
VLIFNKNGNLPATNQNCSPFVIAFIDLKADPRSGKILDIGAQRSDGATLHSPSVLALLDFVRNCNFLCGHNIIRHDLALIGKAAGNAEWGRGKAIDTLLLSPLLFPTRPYHRLIKDAQLLPEEHNDPLEDARKAQALLQSEQAAFHLLQPEVQQVFSSLLRHQPGFAAFFQYCKSSAKSGLE